MCDVVDPKSCWRFVQEGGQTLQGPIPKGVSANGLAPRGEQPCPCEQQHMIEVQTIKATNSRTGAEEVMVLKQEFEGSAEAADEIGAIRSGFKHLIVFESTLHQQLSLWLNRQSRLKKAARPLSAIADEVRTDD
jgi:hypothetical protein